MKGTPLYGLLVVFLLLAVLGSCVPQPGAPTQVPATAVPTAVPTPVPTPAPTPVPTPKKVTFIWTQEFDTLNPLYTNMWFASITFQIWNCWAWDFDDGLNPHPVLVKEMPSVENGGISADGKTITLKLREDIVWSDGTPITAEDFIFTHKMTLDPKNAVATTYPHDLFEVEAPDAHTVVMKFQEPFAAWQGMLWHGLLPKHILEPVYEKDGTLDNAEWNRNPTVGCGPFVFAEWKSANYARFVANEKYWLGRPKIDEILIRFVPDDAAQIAALKAGEGDLGTFIAYTDIPDLQKANVQMVTAFSGYNEGIYFYLDPQKGHPALQDVRVRQAIALATDRASLVRDLLLGLTKPAATDYDNTPWVDPTIQPWPYDPERAKALLDEAGWKDTDGDGVRDKDGVKLELDYGTTTREVRRSTQAVFQQQLAAVGIQVNLLNYEPDIYFAGFGEGGPCATGQLDMFEYSTVAGGFPDPDTSEWYCDQIPSEEKPEGSNWMALCDPELENLFKLQATQVDFKERQQTWWKITRRIYDQVYWLGLWQDPDIWAVGPRLKNVRLSGATPFFNILEWDVAP